MAITFPLKALVQSTGDVILGEFLESDYVGILDGGIGAGGNGGLASTATEAEKLVAIKQQMRSNFSLVKYDEYSVLTDLQSQTPSAGRLAQHGSTLYYASGSTWNAIASALVVDANVTQNIEFGGSISTTYDASTGTTFATVDISGSQAEIDATQLGAGLNSNGTYTTNSSSNYLSTSTSLKEADDALDAAIFSERNRALSVEGTIISDVNTIDSNLQNFEYGGHTTTEVTTSGKTSIVYDPGTGKFEPSANLGVGGFISFTKTNGTQDDIPLVSCYNGNQITSGRVDFFFADGTQDNIDLIINGV